MKKVLSLFLALVMCLSLLGACSKTDREKTNNPVSSYAEDILDDILDEDSLHTETAETIETLPDEFEDIDSDNTDPMFSKEDLTFEENVTHQGQGNHIVNILLVGQDAHESEDRQRSDSMMLVTFNKNKGTITLTSFMRDQYVQIPDYGATKLCHAYAYGGMELLNKTLYNHYGIEIDGNLEVDFSGFESIIDYLGGVDINLTKAEARYLKGEGHSYVTDGVCHLDGETALLYSRLRSIDTDYNRTERQRNVMMSLIEKYKGLSRTEMLTLISDLLPYLTTNMTKDQIVNYGMDLFPIFSDVQINTLRIPADGTFTGGYVKLSDSGKQKIWCQLNIDFAANRTLLEDAFAE